MRWKGNLGAGWRDLHHFCAGIVRENRGEVGHALSDYSYTLNRLDNHHYLYVFIAAKMANAYIKLKDYENAASYAERAINTNPNDAMGYIVKSKVYKQQGQALQGINILEQGFKLSNGNSAELNYHLGVAHFKQGNMEQAQKYATLAYKLGYPLPWLKNQLTAAGLWK